MLSGAVGLSVVALAVCCLCIVFSGVIKYHRGRRRLRQIGTSGILACLSHVDIEAFRQLLDPMEEAFLRQSHSRNDFCEMQKDRIESALGYLKKMANNAIALQALGYRNLRSPNDTQRFLARRLIDRAVPVRMFTFVGIWVLRIWRVLPIRRLLLVSPSLADLKDLMAELLPAYEQLKETALELTVLTEPEFGAELLQNL